MAWIVYPMIQEWPDTGVAWTVYPMIQEWPGLSYDTGVAWTVYPMIQEWPGLGILRYRSGLDCVSGL